MYISSIVNNLKKKYETNNPFMLAKYLNILILYEELGEIKGYYNKYARQKMIHLNNNLDEHELYFTCGHELGHAIMHQNSNTPFLRANTLFSIDKLEIEANQFSVDLIIDDNDIKKYLKEYFYSIDTISTILGMDKDIVEFKINRMVKNKLL